MIKINGDTTLAELMLLRGKYGVERVNVDYNYSGATIHTVRVVLYHPTGRVVGTGATEIQALDDAFARMWHMEAATAGGHADPR